MRKSLIIGLLAIGFAVGFAGAFALQEGEMGGEGKDHEGMPPPPLEDELADAMVGMWNWEGKMWHEGQETPLVATEEIKWGVGHQFLIHSYKSLMPNGTVAYEALGVGRPDPEGGKTKLWWFDNHGELSLFEGERTENGESGIAETGHGKMKSEVSTNEDGTISHKMFIMVPGSEEWLPMLDATGKKAAMGRGPMKKGGMKGRDGGMKKGR